MQADMSLLCLCPRQVGHGPALVWKSQKCMSFSARQVNLGTALVHFHGSWTRPSQSKRTWTCLHPSMWTSSENPSESPILVNCFIFHSLWKYKRPFRLLCFCAVPFDFSLRKCRMKHKDHHLQWVSVLAGPPWRQMGTWTAGWKASGKLYPVSNKYLKA